MARMPAVGDLIDDVFRVEAEVDSGNFGAVFRVHDTLENRLLALKVLKPGPHDEHELRQRFEREARLAYSLRHPHVIEVYYYGEIASGLPYMAMEYLQGSDLRDLLQNHGALGHALVRRIAYEVLSALEAAHALGIVHRDLKPANIFLVNDGAKGHVKVLDFGFAKALEDDAQGDITNAGTLVGTPAYMAPELVHKKNVGHAADLYAVGLIMAEMLLGEKLVKMENVYETIVFQASNKPIKLPPTLKDTPFFAIIAKAVAKRVEDRYRSAAEMIADLKALEVGGRLEDIVVPKPRTMAPAYADGASGSDGFMAPGPLAPLNGEEVLPEHVDMNRADIFDPAQAHAWAGDEDETRTYTPPKGLVRAVRPTVSVELPRLDRAQPHSRPGPTNSIWRDVGIGILIGGVVVALILALLLR